MNDRRVPGNGRQPKRRFVCPLDNREAVTMASDVPPVCENHGVRMVEKRLR